MPKRLKIEQTNLTVRCNVCKHSITFPVDRDGYERFINGMHIQRALPDVSPGLRELMLSGICPKCWDRLFKDDYSEQNNGEFNGLTDDEIVSMN